MYHTGGTHASGVPDETMSDKLQFVAEASTSTS
jgi:hypothetical protein